MTGSPRRRTVVVGEGRAGGSFAAALSVAGWDVDNVGRADLDSGVATRDDVELVLLCVPDSAIEKVAAGLPVSRNRVVAHCAGSLGLDVLGRHPRVASVHPLVALPDPATGAQRLEGAWFAVSGDTVAGDVVAALGGRLVEVDDEHRAAYHAAAVVASNHLVALLGQVERIAAQAGLPLEPFMALVGETVTNVAELGPRAALTGPVSRGDWATVRRHLEAMDEEEREAYLAMAAAAATLVDSALPDLGDGLPDGGDGLPDGGDGLPDGGDGLPDGGDQ